MKRIYCFLVMCFVFNSPFVKVFASSSDTKVKEFAYDSLRLAILGTLDKCLSGKQDQMVADPGGLIVLLGEIDSDPARHLLLQLLDIQIGEANSEALSYAVVKQGKKILPDLKRLLSDPINCSILNNKNFKQTSNKLQCLTVDTRNRRINWLIDIINTGKTLEYVL